MHLSDYYGLIPFFGSALLAIAQNRGQSTFSAPKQGSEHIFCAIIRVVNSVWSIRRTADAWILGCLSNG
jgi:hypothetical protein